MRHILHYAMKRTYGIAHIELERVRPKIFGCGRFLRILSNVGDVNVMVVARYQALEVDVPSIGRPYLEYLKLDGVPIIGVEVRIVCEYQHHTRDVLNEIGDILLALDGEEPLGVVVSPYTI